MQAHQSNYQVTKSDRWPIETTATVLLAGASHDDNPEMVTMRGELAELKALMTTLGSTSIPTTSVGSAHTGKRARVHNNVLTCTVCKKNGHNGHGCWFNVQNKLKEASKMKSDAEDTLKSKKSNKKELLTGFSPDEHNDECLNCVSLKC
jgi:hypothetical protein